MKLWKLARTHHGETYVSNPDYIAAHRHCGDHRDALQRSELCGCFYCLAVFEPGEITEWVDHGGATALCPRCGIDSVIGSASGYPITTKFLRAMNRHWFGAF